MVVARYRYRTTVVRVSSRGIDDRDARASEIQPTNCAKFLWTKLPHSEGIILFLACLLPAPEAASVHADCHAFVFVGLLFTSQD